ncbi:cell wall-binding repeat-containing protein [Mesobacillus jeotgali]|uniref:cell wall-binding repeat-containing protein n=1 Tax=Mesobacillus jeotgali TaxID=129985 RepID=UPI001CFC7C73|nr:cell wall-binding repeat-containing protein [Mesobacillus jeotgali]
MNFKKTYHTGLFFLLLCIFLFPTNAFGQEMINKIVLFKNDSAKQQIIDSGGVITEHFDNFPAVKAQIPIDQITDLANSEDILSIEDDQKVAIEGQLQDWGVSTVQSQKSWNKNFTGKNVKVAVIDSGISPHNDLTISGGKSFVKYTASYDDDNGHGTHIAGIIGAKNNSIGIVGIAPDSMLYALKVLDKDGNGYLTDIIAALDWSVTNKMDILNLSLGSLESSPVLEYAINKAYNSGILIVAAGGNEGKSDGKGDTVAYPAKYVSVIGVSAVNKLKERAPFSATGNTIEFAAPGVSILSTHLNNSYARFSGTSQATGFVTGNLAILKEMYPTMNNSSLREHLKRNSLDLGLPGHDAWFGNGLVQSPFTPERISGMDRYEVAVNVSKRGWSSADTVFISNYNAFADALSAAPLAFKYNSPILITANTQLNLLTKQELIRLKAKNVVVIGGINSIPDKIVTELKSLGLNVRRIDGKDRFEVSKNIANELGTTSTAILANGFKFPDALAVAPYAAKNGYPILLTRADQLPEEISKIIKVKSIKSMIVVGGELSISNDVLKQLPPRERIGGKDRYEVAVNITRNFYPSTTTVYMATGLSFADALTGSVLAAKESNSLILTTKDALPDSVSSLLSERSMDSYFILGGVNSVSNNVLLNLNN